MATLIPQIKTRKIVTGDNVIIPACKSLIVESTSDLSSVFVPQNCGLYTQTQNTLEYCPVKPSQDNEVASISLYNDLLVVGRPSLRKVYTYEKAGAEWNQVNCMGLSAVPDYGRNVLVFSASGTTKLTVASTASGSTGSVLYNYTYNEAKKRWTFVDTFSYSGDSSVGYAMDYQNGYLIGAPDANTGVGAVYMGASGSMMIVGTGSTGASLQGSSVDISSLYSIFGAPGDYSGAGAFWSGSASGTSFEKYGVVIPTGAVFDYSSLPMYGVTGFSELGTSVSLSPDSSYLCVGKPGGTEGAYVFTRVGSEWLLTFSLLGVGAIGTGAQGTSCLITQDDNILLGAPLDNSSKGAIYPFIKEDKLGYSYVQGSTGLSDQGVGYSSGNLTASVTLTSEGKSLYANSSLSNVVNPTNTEGIYGFNRNNSEEWFQSYFIPYSTNNVFVARESTSLSNYLNGLIAHSYKDGQSKSLLRIDDFLLYANSSIDNTWNPMSFTGIFEDICVYRDGFLLCDINGVYRTEGGVYSSLETLPAPSGNNKCISSNYLGDVILIGQSTGFLYISNDFGASWSSKASSKKWRSVSVSKDGQYQTAVPGNSDQIYISSDFGDNWSSVGVIDNYIFVSVDETGKNQLAGGENSYIYQSSDYGQTWTPSTCTGEWRSVTFVGSLRIAYNDTNRSIYMGDEFNSWIPISTSSESLNLRFSSSLRQESSGITESLMIPYPTNPICDLIIPQMSETTIKTSGSGNVIAYKGEVVTDFSKYLFPCVSSMTGNRWSTVAITGPYASTGLWATYSDPILDPTAAVCILKNPLEGIFIAPTGDYLYYTSSSILIDSLAGSNFDPTGTKFFPFGISGAWKDIAASKPTTDSYRVLTCVDGGQYYTTKLNTDFGTDPQIWVAVGQSSINSIKYSTDGKNWSNSSTGYFVGEGFGVAWNGEKWVAVGDDNGGNSIKYSTDGINWTNASTNLFSSQGRGVAWNGEKWVAVGFGTSTIKYSSDGINWFNSVTSFSDYGKGVAWGISGSTGQWIAVGADSSSSIKKSNDGITWTDALSGAFIGEGNGIAWGVTGGTGKWVAVGEDGGGTGTIKYSYDGSIWTDSTGSLFTTIGQGVAFNGEKWVAVGQGGTNIVYSTDGITWTGAMGSLFNILGYGVSWNGSIWVAVGGNGGSTIKTSPDGITWSDASSGGFNFRGNGVAFSSEYRPVVSHGITGPWKAVASSPLDGKYQAVVGSNELIQISSSYGVGWVATGSTANYTAVDISNNGETIMVAASGAYIQGSFDLGASWSSITGVSGPWTSISAISPTELWAVMGTPELYRLSFDTPSTFTSYTIGTNLTKVSGQTNLLLVDDGQTMYINDVFIPSITAQTGVYDCVTRDGISVSVSNGRMNAIFSQPQRKGISLSEDGTKIALSTTLLPDSGLLVPYSLGASGWECYGNIVPTGGSGSNKYGDDCALSFDGQILTVSNPSDNLSQGAVWVYQDNAGVWDQVQKLTTSYTIPTGTYQDYDILKNNRLGNSLSVNEDGSNIYSTINDYAFTRFSDVNWSTEEVRPVEENIIEIQCNGTGDRIAVGVEGAGLRTYLYDGGFIKTFTTDSKLAYSSMSKDGVYLAEGVQSGVANVYYSGPGWVQAGKMVNSATSDVSQFGNRIVGDGTNLLTSGVSASGSTFLAVWPFEYDNGNRAIRFKIDGEEIMKVQSDKVITYVPITGTEGTAAAPSYTFNSDNTSGVYYADGTVGVSIASNEILSVSSSGIVVDGSVTCDSLIAGTVSASALSINTLTASSIFTNTISASGMTANSIYGQNISAQNFTAVNINIQNITATSLSVGVFTASTGTINNFTTTTMTGTNGTITNFTSTNGNITNLTTSSMTGDTIYANTGTINNFTTSVMTAGTATISNLTYTTITGGTINVDNLVVGTLTAATGTISNLTSSIGSIQDLSVGSITGSTGNISNLTSLVGSIQTLSVGSITGSTGNIENLSSTDFSTSSMTADTGTINNFTTSVMTAGTAFIDNLTYTTITGGTINVNNLIVGTLTASTGTIDNFTTTTMTATNVYIDSLIAVTGTIDNFTTTTMTASNGTIDNFTSTTGTITNFQTSVMTGGTATIDYLTYTTITGGSINVNNLIVGSMTATTGNIQNFTTTTMTAINGTIATLSSTTGNIQNFTTTTMTASNGTISTLSSTTGTITNFNTTTMTASNGTIATLSSTTGTITNLFSTNANIQNLTYTTITGGSLTASGTIQGLDFLSSRTGATAGNPNYSFNASTTSGVYLPTTDTLALSAGGAEGIRIIPSGNVGMGTTNPRMEVEINNPTGQCLRLSYNDPTGSSTIFSDLTISASGDLNMTVTGGRKINVGGSTAMLTFPPVVANRKVVLYDAFDNNNQFYGLGIAGNTLRYQVPTNADSHIFYSGTSATASVELFRINGTGGAVSSNNIVPSTGNTYNLGAPATTWANVYAGTGSFTTITAINCNLFKNGSVGVRDFLQLGDTSAGANAKYWGQGPNGNTLFFYAEDDIRTNAFAWMACTRSGTTIQNVTFYPTVLPASNNIQDLGSSATGWRNIYGGTGFFTTMTATNSTTTNLTTTTMTGTTINTNRVLAASGTPALPSHSFIGDNLSGMYLPSINNVGISASGTAVMNFNRLGNTQPLQPSFNVFATGDSNPAGGSLSAVVFAGESHDIGNNVSSTGIFTVPVTGIYLLYTNLRIGNIDAADTFLTINIEAGGAAIGTTVVNPFAAAPSSEISSSVTCIRNLNQGTQCRVTVFPVISSTMTIRGSTSSVSYFSGQLLS